MPDSRINSASENLLTQLFRVISVSMLSQWWHCTRALRVKRPWWKRFGCHHTGWAC